MMYELNKLTRKNGTGGTLVRSREGCPGVPPLPIWVVCHEHRPGVPALRNCTRDEGGPFGFGNQVPISSHRKLLWSKAMVVNVAEKSEQDFDRYD